MKTITAGELYGKLPRVDGKLRDSAIGFVGAKQIGDSRNPGPEDFDGGLAGSGTLVCAAGVRAILTADHVISSGFLQDWFGLIVLPLSNRQCQKLVIRALERIRIGRGPEESKGPDLALVLLWPEDAAKLEALGKVFYNLSKRRERMLQQAPPLDTGCAWVLSGMVDELTRKNRSAAGFVKAIAFEGIYGLVVFRRQRREGEFDYLSVEVDYRGDYCGPEEFGGCSGGGLWQAILKARDGEVVIDELLFAGMPFYQSAKENDRRTIECHGRVSIYDSVVRKLESALP